MTLFRDKETGEEFELESSVGGFYGWNGGWVDEKWLDEYMDLVKADSGVIRRERLAPFLQLNREMAINPDATFNESKLNSFLTRMDDLLGLD